MASINLKNKSKNDLVELVRMSGIMPVSRAQRMPKAELLTHLEFLQDKDFPDQNEEKSSAPLSVEAETEALLKSAPGRLAARNISAQRNSQRDTGSERRSVFMVPDESVTQEERKPFRRSVMAVPDYDLDNAVTAPDKPGAAVTAAEETRQDVRKPADTPQVTEAASEPAETAPAPAKRGRKPRVSARNNSAVKSRNTRTKSASVLQETAEMPAESEASASPVKTDEAPAKAIVSLKGQTASVPVKVRKKPEPAAPSGTQTDSEQNAAVSAGSDEPASSPETGEQAAAQPAAAVQTETPLKRTRGRHRRAGSAVKDAHKTAEDTAMQSTAASAAGSTQQASEPEKTETAAGKTDDGPRAQHVSRKNHKTNIHQKGSRVHGRAVDAKDSQGAAQAVSTTAENGEDEGLTGDVTVKPERQTFDSGEIVSGVMEIMPDGYGFLRRDNYLPGPKDIYIPPQFIRRFNLRQGDYISGPARVQRDSDRYQALYFIKTVNGVSPEQVTHRPHFDRLVPIYPNERFTLETSKNELSTRIIDLIAPIGKGQRGMIVSPPKAGKTILLQKIANAIATNQPDAKLIVLLIDERPEEVTDMQRSIQGEVVYSTFDKTPENHVKITELVLERAERLVEMGQDVVILLDSLTRMSRAYNLTINPTGRTLSGGLDPGALYGPKRFFGAARNIENGGSLTIIATALVETGSRMDEVIFEEFKGTGNMEVSLDRKLSEKRIFPAIDINRSGTRREELLLTPQELEAVWAIRKAFSQLDSSNVTETVINLMMKTNDNRHFVSSINVSLNNRSLFETMKLGTKPGPQSQRGV